MTKETTHLLSSVSAARLIHHSLCWPLLHHSPSASDLFQAHPHTHARANSKVSHVTSVNVRVTRSSSVTKLGTKTRNVILHHAFRPLQSRAGVISAADPSASTSKTNETWLIIIEGVGWGGGRNKLFLSQLWCLRGQEWFTLPYIYCKMEP